MEHSAVKISRSIRTSAIVSKDLPADTANLVNAHITCLLLVEAWSTVEWYVVVGLQCNRTEF